MNLYIVDDSGPLRERLVSAAGEIEGIDVVGQTGLAPEATDQILWLQPNIVILDLRIGDDSGICVLQIVKRAAPATIVILFTNLCDLHYRDRCARVGANYFFDKSTDFERLIQVLGQLARRWNQTTPTPFASQLQNN